MKMKKKILIFVLALIVVWPVRSLALDLKMDSIYEIESDSKPDKIEEGYFLPNFDNNGKFVGTFLTYFDKIDSNYYIVSLNYDFINRKTSSNYDNTEKYLLGSDYVPKSKNPNVKGDGDILFTLYDSDGNVVKSFFYGGNGDDMPGLDMANFSYDEDENIDGYMCVIYSNSTDLDGVEPGTILLKFDLNGNLLWQKNINDYFRSADFDLGISFYGDSNYIEMNNTNEVIWKIDTDFKVTNVSISYDENGKADGVVAIGSTGGDQLKAKAVIAKYDLKGNEVFKDTRTAFEYHDIISSKNEKGNYDGYIVIGDKWTSNTSVSATIIKYDYNGKVVWEDKYDDFQYGALFYKVTYNYDNNGMYNGYLIFTIEATCPISPIKRRVEKQNFVGNKYIARKLNTEEDCIKFDYVTYAYPSYEIVKDNNENGDITISNDKAYPGDVVRISVTPKEGYSLKRIVVIDESGKEIEVRDDGTFIMPEGKVTVTALYNRISNPETVSACYVVLGIILAISIGTLIVTRKKENV